MKTLIIGLGNPILTDDGVGVKAAYAVQNALPQHIRNEVTITEASVGGLRLMEMMVGFDRAIIIDALLLGDDRQPGKIHKLTLDDLREISPTQHSASAHDTTLITALELGHQMGLSLPKDITIFAVEVENVLDFSEDATEAVTLAIPEVIAAVLDELNSSTQG